VGDRLTFKFLLVIMALAGIVIAALRHAQTGIPLFPGDEQTVWMIEARVDFEARGEPVTAVLSLPGRFLPGFEMVEEQAASPGYGFSIFDSGQGRRAEWSKRLADGPQSLYYSAQFVVTSAQRPKAAGEAPPLIPVDWDDAQELAAQDVLRRARSVSSNAQSLTRELIKLLNNADVDQNAALLRPDDGDRAQLLMNLLGREGISTRLVMGLSLEDARRRQSLTSMVEVHDGDYWVLFDPQTAEVGLPENLLMWHRGGVAVLDVLGASGSSVSFSMIRQSVPAQQLAQANDSQTVFSTLGVHRLPIEEQSMFKLLLLLPLGAAVVVFMRIIIGVQTAGTFMPVLISVAFLQTSLIPGLVSFVSVVAIGLALRGYLSQLNLLLVARIAALIVLVIFLISVLSIVGYQLGYSTGMTITFFPMIIIAWTIERMSILWEEEGAREVLIQGGGSLLVAVLAFLLMQWSLVQHLSFNFPELNLVLLALILAMGQYTGYKLTELRRFQAMDDSS